MVLESFSTMNNINNKMILITGASAGIAAKGFPNVRVQIIEDRGHMPMSENPSKFNRLLLDFFRD